MVWDCGLLTLTYHSRELRVLPLQRVISNLDTGGECGISTVECDHNGIMSQQVISVADGVTGGEVAV